MQAEDAKCRCRGEVSDWRSEQAATQEHRRSLEDGDAAWMTGRASLDAHNRVTREQDRLADDRRETALEHVQLQDCYQKLGEIVSRQAILPLIGWM